MAGFQAMSSRVATQSPDEKHGTFGNRLVGSWENGNVARRE